MTEMSLYGFWGCTLCDEQSCAGVSEVVNPQSVGHARRRFRRKPDALVEIRVPQRTTLDSGEHKRRFFRPRPGGQALGKKTSQETRNDDGAVVLGLRRSEDEPATNFGTRLGDVEAGPQQVTS